MSLAVTISTYALDALPGAITRGCGSSSMRRRPTGRGAAPAAEARQIRPVGWATSSPGSRCFGSDSRRRACSTPPARAPALPPRGVGLVTGRESAAERDVVVTLEPAGRRSASSCVPSRSRARPPSAICAALAKPSATPPSMSSSSRAGRVAEGAGLQQRDPAARGRRDGHPRSSAPSGTSRTPAARPCRGRPGLDTHRRRPAGRPGRRGGAASVGRCGGSGPGRHTAPARERAPRPGRSFTARPVMRGRGSVLAGHRETLAALRATRGADWWPARPRARRGDHTASARAVARPRPLDRGFALVQHGDGRLVLGPDGVGVDER